jgi:hypothetical protein
MMNFPTWPCNFPQKAHVSNDDKADRISKKMSKKLPSLGKVIGDLALSGGFEQYKAIKDIALDPIAKESFIKSLDSYLNDLTLKQLSLTKLAEGSYIMNFDIDDPAIPFKEGQKSDL